MFKLVSDAVRGDEALQAFVRNPSLHPDPRYYELLAAALKNHVDATAYLNATVGIRDNGPLTTAGIRARIKNGQAAERVGEIREGSGARLLVWDGWPRAVVFESPAQLTTGFTSCTKACPIEAMRLDLSGCTVDDLYRLDSHLEGLPIWKQTRAFSLVLPSDDVLGDPIGFQRATQIAHVLFHQIYEFNPERIHMVGPHGSTFGVEKILSVIGTPKVFRGVTSLWLQCAGGVGDFGKIVDRGLLPKLVDLTIQGCKVDKRADALNPGSTFVGLLERSNLLQHLGQLRFIGCNVIDEDLVTLADSGRLRDLKTLGVINNSQRLDVGCVTRTHFARVNCLVLTQSPLSSVDALISDDGIFGNLEVLELGGCGKPCAHWAGTTAQKEAMARVAAGGIVTLLSKSGHMTPGDYSLKALDVSLCGKMDQIVGALARNRTYSNIRKLGCDGLPLDKKDVLRAMLKNVPLQGLCALSARFEKAQKQDQLSPDFDVTKLNTRLPNLGWAAFLDGQSTGAHGYRPFGAYPLVGQIVPSIEWFMGES